MGQCVVDFEQATISLADQAFEFTPLGVVPQEIILAGGAENVVRERLG